MFELWARKRPINGLGMPFEFICRFEDYNYRFTSLDLLNRDVYQEAMIINEQQMCVMHVEFEEVLKRKRDRKWN